MYHFPTSSADLRMPDHEPRNEYDDSRQKRDSASPLIIDYLLELSRPEMDKITQRRVMRYNPVIMLAVGLGVVIMLIPGLKAEDKKHRDPGNSKVSDSIVTDVDGNVYATVSIGTQVWMVENLKATHYRDGSDIPYESDDTVWSTLTTGGYCWYNNDSTNKSTYGALYNFHAVIDSRCLCPEGWHIPTEFEWLALEAYLGGEMSLVVR